MVVLPQDGSNCFFRDYKKEAIKIFKTEACNNIDDNSLFFTSQASHENIRTVNGFALHIEI